MSRLALITGAGSGIGRASALALAARGWRIALVGRREDALAETAALAAGEHIVAPADIADAEAVDAVFASCTNLNTFGVIERAENALGKPVISSNSALIWHLSALAGLTAHVPGALRRRAPPPRG